MFTDIQFTKSIFLKNWVAIKKIKVSEYKMPFLSSSF